MPSTRLVNEYAFLSGERNGEDLAGAGELVADGAVALGQAVLGVGGKRGDEGLEVGVVAADGDSPTQDVGAGQGDDASDEEVLAPGFEGVFLVLVPLGKVAVVEAGGG